MTDIDHQVRAARFRVRLHGPDGGFHSPEDAEGKLLSRHMWVAPPNSYRRQLIFDNTAPQEAGHSRTNNSFFFKIGPYYGRGSVSGVGIVRKYTTPDGLPQRQFVQMLPPRQPGNRSRPRSSTGGTTLPNVWN